MDKNTKTNRDFSVLATKLEPSYPFVDFSPQDFKRYSGEERDFSKKRSRMILSPFQTKVLARVFQKTAFPSALVRNNLSKTIGIPSRNIQIWFQNQRQKVRQKEAIVNKPSDYQNRKLLNIGPLDVLARAAFNNEKGALTILPPPKHSKILYFSDSKNQSKHLRPW